MRDFLNERKQRVVLKGQFSTLGSIIGPLLFLIYINGLTEDLSSNATLFVDDTSLFSVIHVIQTSANNLNKDFTQWKMNFNPDTTKQAKDVNFFVVN